MHVVREYRLKRRVQFHETDAAGIVHFSWFYRYMEEAEHGLWRAAGLSIAPSSDARVGFPRVAASFDFHRPLRFEDEFEVHIRIATIGARSIRYAVCVAKDGAAVATGSLTVACVTWTPGAALRSTAIPPEIAGRFGVALPLPDA
ncbi:MAG: acyl-CoA thioesterase [Aphanocapsa feldmannii 277cV]|uniref:Acyl-CoA thioesterase n=2 Tax=Aphanocapsa feldmannii TaxID=192050 RepID=A0A524RLX4_9CHRO|nr:MAG: acyl-CoA thioesterase [Aphanocapsa feldmannii 277cV]TGH27564.1 MAG: acyl-CoA thioesterase [Aphanocapsa feldmannii 277cI]